MLERLGNNFICFTPSKASGSLQRRVLKPQLPLKTPMADVPLRRAVKAQFLRVPAIGVLFFFCCMAIAAPTLQERLDTFQTLSAEFTQTTLSDGAKETLKGIMKIKRPNRFYWKIEQPYPQEIVSNGQTLWQFEPDLDQVIVRKVDAELQGVPLLLLSGKTSELETLFTVKAESDSRFTLTPKSEDQVVKKVVIAFSQDRLKSLTIENTLGQDIQIVFSKVEQNTPLEDQAFEFKIPKGVEVLEQ